MRAIDADKLLRDIEKYNVSDGKFQHWVQIQPTIKPETCEDAVSRQDALNVLDGLQIAHEQGEYGCYAEYRKHMCELPSVTPKRKTGKWIHSDFSHEFLQCSECGRGRYFCSNFCSNCGARMDGSE